MRKNSIFILFLFFLIPLFLPGQCPDKKWLRERIIFLRDSARITPKHQLEELLRYETLAQYCSYKNDSTRIFLLQRISKMYMDNAEYTHSIFYTSRAINLVSANAGSAMVNPASQIRNYYNLSLAFNALKKTTEKIRAYDSCIAVGTRLRIVNLHFIYSLLQKVKYLNDIGEYSFCINRSDLGEALSHKYIFEKNMGRYGDSTSFSYDFAIQKVTALLALKKINEAEIFLIKKIEDCKKKNALSHLGTLYENLAMIQVQHKGYKQSMFYFNQALKYYKQQKDTLSYKIAVSNIGFNLYHETYKDDKKALFYYKQSLAYMVRDPERSKLDSINSINIYSNIAAVFVNWHQFDSAQYYLQCAFNQIKKGTNEVEILNSSLSELIQNQKVEYITSLFIDKGNAFYEQFMTSGNALAIDNAIRVYKLTDQLLDWIKTNQIELQSKLFWRKDMHHFYEQAIRACKAGNRPEDAFYFFERSRAILLYDQMDEQNWLGQTDIAKQRELSDKISNLEKQALYMDSNSPDFARLQNELSEVKEKMRHLRQQLKARNPLYYQSFLVSNFTPLRDIRRYLLLHQQTLMEIFAGDSNVYSLIITSTDIYFNQINKTDYDSTLNLCISYMSDPALSNRKNQFKSFIKNSRRLHNLIFQSTRVPDGRIIISIDGKHFPFETLVTNFENEVPVYFVQNHAVSYTYSARYLMSQFTGHSSLIPRNFLGIAPVEFPGKQHLPGLPGSDVATEDARALFDHSESLIKEKATRANFLKTFGQYQVIQLYSHSSDSSARGEPVIYFADEPLYLSELGNMETPFTKLIVLSACETGSGQFNQGEGVFSFDRAFAALGIPSCINNLWSVDNESTYKITQGFLKYISEGLPIDVALQKAKLEFITNASQKQTMPYYWASTILAGKADAIKFKSRYNIQVMFVAVAGVAALLAIVVLIIRRRKFTRTLTTRIE